MIKRLQEFTARSFGPGAWSGLLLGGAIIIAATAYLGYLFLRTDYQVLFADLMPQDMATMTAELERQKIPYSLGEISVDGSGTILVDRQDVLKTRLKLMGRDMPLHGAVGFELFNSGDLGMTEFAQKVNFQRALQGELTRTILSLTEIRDARVLLALPEQGLFKQTSSKPKASVTLSVRAGQTLRTEQIMGIQRLVAAAIPGILQQDVTIVDQTGVAMTRPGSDAGVESDGASLSVRLDLKRDTEAYLSRKANAVLERALGAGQAMASVDVVLNMDRVQSSLDEVVGAPDRRGRESGLILKERETSRDSGPPLNGSGANSVAPSVGSSTQREVEYALGRRVEQVVSQPGSVRRIQVAVVVQKTLSAVQQEHLRQMMMASVGAIAERGDGVVVRTMDSFAQPMDETADGSSVAGGSSKTEKEARPGRVISASTHALSGEKTQLDVILILSALMVLVLLGWLLVRRRAMTSMGPVPHMSTAQREATLSSLREWMQGARGIDSATHAGEGAVRERKA